MKRTITLLFVMLLLSAFVACGGGGADESVLSLWSFTDELERPIERFEEQNPGVTIELTIVPNEEYLSKLRPVLRSKKNAPDIFTAEFAYVKDIVENGYWDDLSQAPYNASVSDLVPYQVEMGTDSTGVLRGLSWQTTPGGFFYRRSLAKKYLGVDSPDAVGTLISSPNSFLEIARLLKQVSGGEVKIIPGHADYMWYPLSSRREAFVNSNNEFVIDPTILEYFDISKTFRDEQLVAEQPQWSPGWFEGMQVDTNIFGYILPTWGLHYVLKANAPDSSGDWGLASGPSSYFWGGTWLGINKDSEKKENAWKFVQMMTLDQETLEWWAKETGDFIGNEVVLEKIRNDFSEEYLAGQNHYEFFAREAPQVNAALVTRYDLELRDMMMRAVGDYIEGIKTKDEAIEAWKEEVRSAYPDLIVQ